MEPDDLDLASYPEDPFDTSTSALAESESEIRIPCGRTPILLGAGVKVSDGKQQYLPRETTPFAIVDAARLGTFVQDSKASYREASTSGSAAKMEHLAFSASVGIGGSLLGASIQGSYEKRVRSNQDSERVSIHSSYRMGMITFNELPEFSGRAWNSVPHRYSGSKDKNSFFELFGDYYVGGLVIGADNSVMVSTSSKSAQAEEKLQVRVTLKLLFRKKEFTKESSSSVSVHMSEISVAGFDTLDENSIDQRIKQGQSVDHNMLQQAVNSGKTLEARVRARMQEFQLEDGKEISAEMCANIIRSGLICEVLMCPISKTPDYIRARQRF